MQIPPLGCIKGTYHHVRSQEGFPLIFHRVGRAQLGSIAVGSVSADQGHIVFMEAYYCFIGVKSQACMLQAASVGRCCIEQPRE